MSKIKNKTLTKSVFKILCNNPELRDDWLGKVRAIHDEEMILNNISEKEYYQTVFFTEKLSNTDTIKRIWALIQEKKEELRGLKWEERQRQGGIVSKDIIFFDIQQLKLFSDEQ